MKDIKSKNTKWPPVGGHLSDMTEGNRVEDTAGDLLNKKGGLK